MRPTEKGKIENALKHTKNNKAAGKDKKLC